VRRIAPKAAQVVFMAVHDYTGALIAAKLPGSRP
jgi:hypothetical protein